MFLDTHYFLEKYGKRIQSENLAMDQRGAWTYWWKFGQTQGCYPNSFVSGETGGHLIIYDHCPRDRICYPDWGIILGENRDNLHQPSELKERFCYWEPWTRETREIERMLKEIFNPSINIIVIFDINQNIT